MFEKKCPYCQKYSYSASEKGVKWICPHCKRDISHIPANIPKPPKC